MTAIRLIKRSLATFALAVVERHIGVMSITDAGVLRAERF